MHIFPGQIAQVNFHPVKIIVLYLSPGGKCLFRTTVNLGAGEHRIWSRAVDERGNAQPLNGSVWWNPSGYEWHGADYVDVTAS